MRLSSLAAACASFGAALAALPEGPFEISVLPINGTEPWATNLATVSHGYVILSLSTGSSAKFTWNAFVSTGRWQLPSKTRVY
jgi:hypothetical protein